MAERDAAPAQPNPDGRQEARGSATGDDADPVEAHLYQRRHFRQAWLIRRQRKIREEIARNRRGEYKIPTWALTLILVAVVAAWALVIFLS